MQPLSAAPQLVLLTAALVQMCKAAQLPTACPQPAPQHPVVTSVIGRFGRCVADAPVIHSAAAAWTSQQTARAWGISRGLQSSGNMMRMRRFADKLLKGNNVTITVAGGSISRGWSDSDKLSSDGRGCDSAPSDGQGWCCTTMYEYCPE
jgi:hypothetical protein